jgi:hypothetical protein
MAVAMSYDPRATSSTTPRRASCRSRSPSTTPAAWPRPGATCKLTPTSYVVNKKGEIVKRYVGEPDFAELHQLIEKLLAEA